MGQIIMSGIVPKLTIPISGGGNGSGGSSYNANFEDNTWQQIITACQSNSVPETWVVGDSKSMTINGTDYQIDIIGKNHDTYSSGGTAPLTFQMHDCYTTNYQMNSSESNSGGWTNCNMRKTHLPAILTKMPSEVQSGIKEVNKLTTAGNQSSTVNTTADKLFLLSEVEYLGYTNNSLSGEGSQYAYYSAGNSQDKGDMHWLRSPYKGDSGCFCVHHSSDSTSSPKTTYYVANYSNGHTVAFAFCF